MKKLSRFLNRQNRSRQRRNLRRLVRGQIILKGVKSNAV